MSDARRFCENCGTAIGETANFCPSCGAAQRPDPEIPSGPPPGAPEPGRIGMPNTGVPPPPSGQPQGGGWPPAFRWGGAGCVVLVLLGLATCAAIIGNAPNNDSR